MSARTASKWVGALPREGEAGLLRSLVGAAPRAASHAARSGWRRSRAAAVADDGGRDRRGCCRCRSRRCRRCCCGSGSGKRQPARAARAAEPLRARAGRASWCTSTSRSSAGSRAAPGTASHGDQARRNADSGKRRRSAGSTSTSASTTPPAWPTSRCSTTRRPPPPSASCAARVAFYARHGIHVERVMTDNGSAYRSTLHALACRALGLRHLRTRPYRPRTNGKAERFIRTLLGGWAYGAIYGHSAERTARPRRLARPLQSPPTTRQPQPPAAPQPPHAAEEQRSWVLQLAQEDDPGGGEDRRGMMHPPSRGVARGLMPIRQPSSASPMRSTLRLISAVALRMLPQPSGWAAAQARSAVPSPWLAGRAGCRARPRDARSPRRRRTPGKHLMPPPAPTRPAAAGGALFLIGLTRAGGHARSRRMAEAAATSLFAQRGRALVRSPSAHSASRPSSSRRWPSWCSTRCAPPRRSAAAR